MIKHFNQGSLDGLCGVYAIVNAVVHRIIQVREFSEDNADLLFKISIKSLSRDLFPDVLFDGLNHRQLLELSRTVAKKFGDETGIVMEVSSPFRKGSISSVTEFLDAVSPLHSEVCCAFVFGISYVEDDEIAGGHWVAFKEFAPHGIKVINNSRQNFINSTKLRVNGTGKNRLDYWETIMFKLVSINGEPYD